MYEMMPKQSCPNVYDVRCVIFNMIICFGQAEFMITQLFVQFVQLQFAITHYNAELVSSGGAEHWVVDAVMQSRITWTADSKIC